MFPCLETKIIDLLEVDKNGNGFSSKRGVIGSTVLVTRLG